MGKFRYPKSVFDFYDRFCWVYFITATMPYFRRKIDGEIVFQKRKICPGNIIPIIVFMGTLSTAHYIRYSMLKDNFLGNVALILQLSGMAVTILFTQITVLVKQDQLIDMFTSIDAADRDLLQLRVRVSYKIAYILTVGCTSCMPVPPSFVIWSDRVMLLKVLDIFGYSMPLITRISILFMTINILHMIKNRLELLNRYIESLIDGNLYGAQEIQPMLYRSRSHLYNFVTISKVYECLLHACECYKNLYSGIILLYIAFNYIQCVFAIYFCYKGSSPELALPELIAVLLSATLQVGILGCFASDTENEARTTLALMGLLNLESDTFDFVTKRNTFLLEGLHTRLEFTLCGLFPLRLSLFIQQVSICTTFIFILINT